jgi:hypothetical protein
MNFIGELRPRAENQASNDRTKGKSTDEHKRREAAGSRLDAALTGQLIVGSPLASRLDANALAP